MKKRIGILFIALLMSIFANTLYANEEHHDDETTTKAAVAIPNDNAVNPGTPVMPPNNMMDNSTGSAVMPGNMMEMMSNMSEMMKNCQQMMKMMSNMGNMKSGDMMNKSASSENAESILKLRFAKGEITEEQYYEMKKVIADEKETRKKVNTNTH